MDIIAGHMNCDLDAFASMVAAQRLYPEAVLIFTGSVNQNVREFIALHGDMLDFAGLASLDLRAIERVIMVDTKIADRLGELKPVLCNSEVEVFAFDHHPGTPEDLPGIKDCTELVGATTTVLVGIIAERNLPVTPFEATVFALGIHEDTGSLTFPTSTPEDAEAIAWLMRQGVNVSVLARFLAGALTAEQHALMNSLLADFREVDIAGIRVSLATATADSYVEGVSVVAHKIAELENPEVLFVLVEMLGRVHMVGRSRLAQVPVDVILAGFGGGGHKQAASAVAKNKPLLEVEAELLDAVRHKSRPMLTASQIMSGPVRTVSETTTITEAARRMRQTGHTAFPVVDENGLLSGIISRKDLDKAAHHGLGHAPVKGFMTRDLVSVQPSSSIQEVQALMMEYAIGRVPVMDNGVIKGIVTRKDVLRALHGTEYLEGFYPVERTASRYTKQEITGLMDELLPREVQSLLRTISHEAERKGFNVFLVGGFVRDLLLREPNLDLDLVVEGDGITLARYLSGVLGGRMRSHRKFGTAVLILPGGQRIDIASARTEFYERPAALPTVEFSSIRQDLYRRDFSINSMAIALTGEDFGELLDYFGGQRDLEKRQVRILHNLSFVEDPTRIFRAVRFEQRYDFSMEPQTEILARRAIEMEFVGRLTNARVRDELKDILTERAALNALKRLEELGALKSLHPDLKVSRDLEKRFKQVEKCYPSFEKRFLEWQETHKKEAGREPRRWLVSLMALMQDMDEEELRRWAQQMRLRKDETYVVLEGVRRVPRLVKVLAEEPLPPSGLYFLLDPLKTEALAYLYATGGPASRAAVLKFFDVHRNSHLDIGGEDLEGMGLHPSEMFSTIIEKVRVAKLDGRVRGRDEQLELAAVLVAELKGAKLDQ